jgi:hypothetical protein
MNKLLTSAIGTMSLAFLSSPHSAIADCPDFHFLERGFISEVADHQDAIILIDYGPDKAGTAFLIDGDHGLFLTARHVVAPSLNSPLLAVPGKTQDGKSLQLKVLKDDPQLDVALLQVNHAEWLSNALAYELYFARVKRDAEVTFPGLAFAQSRGDVTPSMPPPNAPTYSANGPHVWVRILVNDGDSGAPMFTKEGLAMGLVLGKRSVTEADAIPMPRLAPFLAEYSVGDEAMQFRRRFLATTDANELQRMLVPSRRHGSVSNLHLAGAIRMMLDGHDLEQIKPETIECPLAIAAGDRGLAELARALIRLTGQRTPARSESTPPPASPPAHAAAIGRWLQAKASMFERRGDQETARLVFLDSLSQYEVALSEALATDPDKEFFRTFLDQGRSREEYTNKVRQVLSRLGILDLMPAGDRAVIASYSPTIGGKPKSDRFSSLLLQLTNSAAGAAGLPVQVVDLDGRQLSRVVWEVADDGIDTTYTPKMTAAAAWSVLTAQSAAQRAESLFALAGTQLVAGVPETAAQLAAESMRIVVIPEAESLYVSAKTRLQGAVTSSAAVANLRGERDSRPSEVEALAVSPERAFPGGGRTYTYHTAPTFACPGMDWLLTTGENGNISGILAWDQKNSVARAEGSIKDGQVQITATEVGGQGRTATITGTVDAQGWLVLNFAGPKVKCDGINVPFWTPQ